MERVIVDSSVLYSVGYDAKKGDLEIRFKDGNMYRYLAVPATVYLELMNADSKDAFFDSGIKNQYVFRQLLKSE